ncbi:MAG: phage tail fiber protein, partial [Candidatus Thalassarchaeaceae archaeon]|nr:phage tail fiber protein [Candidatus Thalassarchaeaceae archaeon]
MALTYTDYIFAGGDAPTYPVTFPYLDPSDIYVLVNGISTDEFVFNADSDTVTLNTAPPVGTVVRVYRSTPGLTEDQPTMLVDFQDGSVLSESDLDKANDQLLYCLQETNDGAQSGLIIDYDGNYNAGGKRIKQVGAPTSDNDATTKAYVDGIALYGDGFAAQSAPQQWVFSGSDFTGTTGNVSVVLLDPEPLATSVYMYVVDLDGVMQNPGIDFYVSGHTFVLVMDENALDPDATIVIRNFGIARSILQTPITSDAPDVVALSVKSLEIQNANLQEWTDSDGTAVACIAPTGDAEVKNLDVDGDITLSGSIVSPDGTPLGGSLEALSDTEIDGASDGEVLTYDAASDKWIAELPAAGDATLDDITDVNVPAPTDGQVLTWNTESGQWVAATPTGGGGGGGGDVSVIAAVSPGIYEGVDNTITLSGNFSLSINDKITFAYGEVKTEVEPIAATSTKVLVAVPPEIYALPTDSVVSVSVNDVVPLSVIILPTPTGGDY